MSFNEIATFLKAEDTGDTDGVYVERNGEKIMYKDIAIELKRQ